MENQSWYRPTPEEYDWYDKIMRRGDGCHVSVTDVALALHGAVCGSGEDSDAGMYLNAKVLEFILKKWRPSTGGSEKFDNAVKTMIEAALEEYRKYCDKPKLREAVVEEDTRSF